MNKKDILIVCALEEETNDKLDGWNVVYTGVGKVNATYELTAELFFQKKISHLPKLIINFGTAGSREIPIHTLVDCTQFIQRDMDVTALGFKIGETPFERSSDSSMIDFSHIKNPIGKNLCCYTGDSFATDLTPYDDVVDMEAYALAKTCWKEGIDFVSYKYISDDGNADDWEKNCGKGIKEFKKLLNEIL